MEVDVEVDVYDAVIGTVIEFTVGDKGGVVYDLELRDPGTWLCWHHGRHRPPAGGAEYYQFEVIQNLELGNWVARAVRRPAPCIKPKTQAYKMSHTAQRLKALAKLGVTTTFRPDGWVIFNNDWCRLEVSPESEFPEGLKKAELVF